MAKYTVEEKYSKVYEKDYKIPFINLIPGFVWSIPLHQKLFPEVDFWLLAIITLAFITTYVVLSMKPWVAIVPCIAGVVIYTALFWALADYIGNDLVKYTIKGVILILAILVEALVFGNATLPWLESKEANKPKIRVEK